MEGLKKSFKKYVPLSLIPLAKRLFTRQGGFSPIVNINYTPLYEQKRVLFSYVTSTLTRGIALWGKNTISNEASLIIKNFIGEGFVIDAIDCNNLKGYTKLKGTKYHVVFGFGTVFYQACIDNPGIKKILYLTEKYPSYSKKAEAERIKYFAQRHKKKISFERTGLFYKEDHFTLADYIIYLGKPTDANFILTDSPKFCIHSSGLVNKNYCLVKKDYESAKNNFLWFGSRGAIHKGLDLLIDVFNTLPEANLYITGLTEKDRRLIPKFNSSFANITDLGFVNVQSEQFIQLMNTCTYVILPSCSEGMSTSTITCMNHGLIPVVTDACGIDVSEHGFLIESIEITALREMILGLLQRAIADNKMLSNKVRNYSLEHYSLNNFNKAIGAHLVTILNEPKDE